MPIVSGKLTAETAYAYNGKGLTYSNYDCIHFVNLVRETCGLNVLSQSTNRVWRSSSALSWKGTIQEAYQRFNGVLPQGLYLFHVTPDDDPGADPDHYGYGDGIGDVNHIGIYTNIGLGVMQSGGYDGTGVHDSRLRSYFNLAGCASGIDYEGRLEAPMPDPAFYREFWVSPDINVLEDKMTKQNANCVKSKMVNDLGWTLQSVCGILGNMQYESGINPAYIESTYRDLLPSEEDLTDLPNYVMMYFMQSTYQTPLNEYGLGLCQWSTTTTTNYLEQSYIVARAIKDPYSGSNSNRQRWYDGWFQCKRINTERSQDSQIRRFDPNEVNGVRYTFANYAIATTSAGDCAEAWAVGYQKTSIDIALRRQYAEDWYTYFTTVNPEYIPEPPPEPYTRPSVPWYIIYGKRRKELSKPCREL